MPDAVEFVVAGIPQPQGSYRQVPVGRRCNSCGRAPMAVTTDNPALEAWRNDVARYASRAMAGAQPWTGPVAAELIFVVPAPARIPGDRKGMPTARPDLDKLERAIYDACGGREGPGIVYADDSQIVEHHNRKRYPFPDEVPGVIIRMRAIAPTPDAVQQPLFGEEEDTHA